MTEDEKELARQELERAEKELSHQDKTLDLPRQIPAHLEDKGSPVSMSVSEASPTTPQGKKLSEENLAETCAELRKRLSELEQRVGARQESAVAGYKARISELETHIKELTTILEKWTKILGPGEKKAPRGCEEGGLSPIKETEA